MFWLVSSCSVFVVSGDMLIWIGVRTVDGIDEIDGAEALVVMIDDKDANVLAVSASVFATVIRVLPSSSIFLVFS